MTVSLNGDGRQAMVFQTRLPEHVGERLAEGNSKTPYANPPVNIAGCELTIYNDQP